ncbi:hypothetical protein [Enhydrobacter aerosaccus]|uniref:hypothetical protein n=1 Tax=Enhydrobacter aerosaccus TaxID=225324 RepID=UPI000A2EFAF7|nr:hypothetical protein [Enhydrobacter aerosaccus]
MTAQLGEYVPLAVGKFRQAYALLIAGSNGEAPLDGDPMPDLATAYSDPGTGEVVPLPDTPFNRAWVAAGRLFEDPAERTSFYKRVELLTEVADPKYLKYFGSDAGSMHGVLLLALVTVAFTDGMSKEALQSAFDTAFDWHFARMVSLDRKQSRRRH